MKYAIMGAGGVGGYFGARLAAAGDEVAFIARGAHKDAMKANGLTLHSPLGDARLEAVEVMDDPDDVGLCDIILFCVKLWDVEAAAETIRPLLSNDTCVAPIQNGVSVTGALSRLLGAKHVIGAVTQISASIEAPGVIRHHGDFARLIFGELDGSDSWRTECLEAACASAGIEARVSQNIEVEIWEKFVFLAPMAGATAFYRAAIGAVRDDPERRARFEAMLRETAALGRAKGVALPDGLEERLLGFVQGLPPEMKSSMQLDLERGKRLELDWLNGEVVRLGQELGVETPENAAVYEALKPYALGPGG
ncbi:MAG: 2-dehydropantoate 2-reductase [Proteobacteria bacterium]|nr:2-dehydropantoate 2-reductase [Pseudomonadota bacterium]